MASVMLGRVRFSYTNLEDAQAWNGSSHTYLNTAQIEAIKNDPSKDAKEELKDFRYSTTVIIPKDAIHPVKKRPVMDVLKDAVYEAIDFALSKGRIKKDQAAQLKEDWNDSAALMAKTMNGLKTVVRDGDGPANKNNEDYLKGCYYFSANRKAFQGQPQVVHPVLGKIEALAPSEVYSGCYGFVDVNPYVYTGQSTGLAFGLNYVMKTEDGERLDGERSVDAAFSGMDEYLSELAGAAGGAAAESFGSSALD